MAGLYSHTTRSSGTTLTASIYNTDHQNHINNHVPNQMDDYSTDDAEMRVQTDPFPADATSRATHLAGELERLRYQLDLVIGETYWYEDPNISLSTVNTNFNNLIVQVRMFM